MGPILSQKFLDKVYKAAVNEEREKQLLNIHENCEMSPSKQSFVSIELSEDEIERRREE